MRKFVMVVVLVFFLFDATAQNKVAQVTCTFLNRPNAEVLILKPVNHAVFFAARKTSQLDEKSSITIPLSKSETGFLKIICKDQVINLYVQDGDSIQVIVDTGVITKPLIAGANREGQKLLNEPSIPNYFQDILPLFRKDSTIELLSKRVESEKQKYIEQFGKLYDAKLVDSNFFNFCKKNLDYIYATVLVNKMAERFYPVTYPKNHPAYRSDYPEEYAKYWDAVLDVFPLNDSSLLSIPAYEWYAENMINVNFYRKRWEKGDTAKRDEAAFIRGKFDDIKQYFKGDIAAVTQARQLFSMYIQEQFEKPLIDIFDSLAKQPAASPYLLYLQPYHQKVKQFHESSVTKNRQAISFIKNGGRINSFQELMQLFKGKKIYIDIWATWCGPCKEEFKYKDAAKKVLTEKAVGVLYISMDLDNRDEQWKKMIQYFRLEGQHIRTNDALRNDLMKIFWDGKSYSIPRYILLDETGTIQKSNAARPSEVEKLKRQIEQFSIPNQSN
jgi:thiol-disulfide isomerase/thioredoxin